MSLGFTVSGVLLWVIMQWWLRHDGMTLADLGWGRPTNVAGMLLALLVGAGWLLFLIYAGVVVAIALALVVVTRGRLGSSTVPVESETPAPAGA